MPIGIQGRNKNSGRDPQNAVLYLRVSTLKQAEDGVSLAAQEAAGRAYAAKHGLVISKVYREPGASARTGNRSAFKRMLIDLVDVNAQPQAGAPSIVITYMTSRFMRNVLDSKTVLRGCETLVSVGRDS